MGTSAYKLLAATLLLLWVAICHGQQRDFLVPHSTINSYVSSGRFTKKSGVAIPADNYCITKAEALAWLNLTVSYLPSDDRLPVWQQLVPSFGNTVQQQAFTRTGCNTGYTGTSVTYTIAAGAYTDTTQALANSQAQVALVAGGPAYAQQNGQCLVISPKIIRATMTKINAQNVGTDTYYDLQVCFYNIADNSRATVTNVQVYVEQDGYEDGNPDYPYTNTLTAIVSGQCVIAFPKALTFHKNGTVSQVTDNIYYKLLSGDVY